MKKGHGELYSTVAVVMWYCTVLYPVQYSRVQRTVPVQQNNDVMCSTALYCSTYGTRVCLYYADIGNSAIPHLIHFNLPKGAVGPVGVRLRLKTE